MSDINLDFTVSNTSINFTVEPNDITFTPTDIQLTFTAIGSPPAGGANGTVQFNAGGVFGGSTAFTYDGTNSTVNMNNANIGNSYLGSASNVHITGGANGLFLRTDGAGNLSWAAGSLAPGGINASIQFNDSTSFNGSSNLTFNTSTNTVNVIGNVNATYYIGNGSLLNNISGANVAGFVPNAVYSNSAGNINSATFAIENISIISAQTGTYNFDLLNNSIKYSTANATSNLVLNFRGNSSISTDSLVGNSKSITATYVMTTGATAYRITGVQIDGSSQTINWAAGSIPLSGANTKNSYTFTLIKTSTSPTYAVLGSLTRYS
jgi:hypothetical protein